MNKHAWARPTTAEEAHRRAGGRARHNAHRRQKAERRRALLRTLLDGQRPCRGELAELAERLGVSVATVSRDVAKLRARGLLVERRLLAFKDILAQLRRIGF